MTKLSILLLFSLALNLFSLEIAHPTVIVSPADSPEVDKVAAGELQYYLKQITGNELMIVSKRPKDTPAILIGLQSGEQWKEDEIKIDMPDEQTLILTGAPPRGARYAVSTFLQDHCGVLFLSPDFEVIPPKKKAGIFQTALQLCAAMCLPATRRIARARPSRLEVLYQAEDQRQPLL